ncbi:hypothetical protein TRFO_42796 [Tritrichomonas foetus]|uniref:Myb-like DNA-binding domain containing protein n=1 Tax=Tritrichomonas foetus TaxID=1144522 RepID=A0A1J4KZ69_9EUKA|nr:hypothetical protein TRFO_42796 [Tritrichomonas foetus]|eukprot:OHT14988.1 hypothetical protein TRFO_42796 [Tritrichomonas foetus]
MNFHSLILKFKTKNAFKKLCAFIEWPQKVLKKKMLNSSFCSSSSSNTKSPTSSTCIPPMPIVHLQAGIVQIPSAKFSPKLTANPPSTISSNLSPGTPPNCPLGHAQNSSSGISVSIGSSSNSRKKFSSEEDKHLKELVEKHGAKNWDKIAELMPGRTGRQCRDRYRNYLIPGFFNGQWSQDEDDLLRVKYHEFGPQWAKMTPFFHGRSANSLKNRWNYFVCRTSPSSSPSGSSVPSSSSLSSIPSNSSSTSNSPSYSPYSLSLSQLNTLQPNTSSSLPSFSAVVQKSEPSFLLEQSITLPPKFRMLSTMFASAVKVDVTHA